MRGYRDGTISGSWRETAHNAAGTISGHASGDHIFAAASGSNFAASLSLATHGNRQSVAIRPQGIDVTGVSITLSRQGEAQNGAHPHHPMAEPRLFVLPFHAGLRTRAPGASDEWRE
jgi:hypothetical protein